MEKNIPHYPLAEIEVQMTTVQELNLTVSARTGIRAAGMAQASSEQVITLLFRSRSCDMASKWNGQSCDLCGAGTLHDGIKTMTQKYKGQVFSSETHGAFCDHCADGFVEFDEAEELAWLAFRDRVDAAEAAELARIRKKLRLTQMEAAQIAGGGKNAFSRYERGQVKPGAAVVNLFRLLDRHPELLGELSTR